MSGSIEFRAFNSRPAASSAAADRLASMLKARLSADPAAQASLVVSGGTTPGLCFDQLSTEPLDWSRVTVLPSDERWVPDSDPDSNERLIKNRLLKGQARQGRVLSFFRQGIEAQDAPQLIERDLRKVQRPFSASLLGMGQDGHFASLFPDFARLSDALDPRGKPQCIMVKTAGSPYLRISLTLSALLDSTGIILLIFGGAKRSVFDASLDGCSDFPIESLLRHVSTPLTVFWAP